MISLPDYLDLADQRIVNSVDAVNFKASGPFDENGDLPVDDSSVIPLINGAWRDLLTGPHAAVAREVDALYYGSLANSDEETRLLRERRRIYALAKAHPEMASELRAALRAAESKIKLNLQVKLGMIDKVSTTSFMNLDSVNDLNGARRQAVMNLRERMDAYYRTERGTCPFSL